MTRLTGIYNRRGAESQIDSLLLAKIPGVLLMIDVDYFKSVNDSFGHEIGDRTLVEVARTLRRFFASNDIVMRFGGDEFIVFIKGEKDRRRLAARLTDLCDQIDALDDFPDGNSVSISIGAAMYAGKGVVDYEYLRRQADIRSSKAAAMALRSGRPQKIRILSRTASNWRLFLL